MDAVNFIMHVHWGLTNHGYRFRLPIHFVWGNFLGVSLSGSCWCGYIGDLDTTQAVGWLNREDLSRGMEPFPIPVCDANAYMMPFRYMSSSRVHDQASLRLSLYSPNLGSCCNCETYDCLTSPNSCECGRASGGNIAYREGGILKDRFLDPGVHNSSNKRRKNSTSSKPGMRGRIMYGNRVSRTFIRECSVRCRCHKKCGNRVVQQGMKYGVEIFQTKNAK